MSTLAKIFVVFNLVLTVIFFGSSATLYLNREEWRGAYLNANSTFEQKTKQMELAFAKQREQLKRIEIQNGELQSTSHALTAEKNKLSSRIKELDTANHEMQSTVRKNSEAIKVEVARNEKLQTRLSDKDGQIDTYRQQKDDAQAAQEKAVKDVTRLKLDFDKLSQDQSQALIANATLQDDLDRLNVIMENMVARGINPETFEVPFIEGVVEAVNEDGGLVVLSVGKEQKAAPGYELFVRRGGEYIGKLKAIRVYDSLSGARIVYTRDGESVQIGDQVATYQ